MNFFSNIFSEKCPYCKGKLEEKPKRMTKCPQCQSDIYIRDGKLKTALEKDFIDFAKRLHNWLGTTVSDLEREHTKLSDKFGTKASANDTVWSILNQSLLPDDNERNSWLYAEMARISRMEGKDVNEYKRKFLIKDQLQLKRQSIKKDLLKLKKERDKVWNEWGEDIPYVVTIFTCNDHAVCDRCKELSERKHTIEELLEKMPIPDECESELGCRCWISGRTDILAA
jgi:hypothetical protein